MKYWFLSSQYISVWQAPQGISCCCVATRCNILPLISLKYRPVASEITVRLATIYNHRTICIRIWLMVTTAATKNHDDEDTDWYIHAWERKDRFWQMIRIEIPGGGFCYGGTGNVRTSTHVCITLWPVSIALNLEEIRWLECSSSIYL